MTKKSPPKWLFRLVSARPEELPSATMMFFYFFLLTASIYIFKPVKAPLYLTWLKADGLPYAYLVTALLIGFFVTLFGTVLGLFYAWLIGRSDIPMKGLMKALFTLTYMIPPFFGAMASSLLLAPPSG